ncbi:putative anti-sigma regulatory factor, serine/threonine protein kinase [Thermomonospora curvata DSM 43183]|uniref:Putative anti-sigma regulatory factor, serine/threonine protein kinase n=2 Tax=Thermomonospora curvata TaxID=2020 RepID=D1A2K7_THECD|nr:putative anti-sigma regulatory factor, serine/threonine protein kinase [Thermomonospora curvata DSM 43183]
MNVRKWECTNSPVRPLISAAWPPFGVTACEHEATEHNDAHPRPDTDRPREVHMLTMIPRTCTAAPLYWRRTFPGEAAQARAARRFVACLLDGLPCLDEVVLTVDELVANALRHTKSGQAGGSFTVEVLAGPDGVAVAVADQGGPTEPAARDAADTDENGRGLRTVSLTATSWGWHGNDSGRTVTAVFTAGAKERAQ